MPNSRATLRVAGAWRIEGKLPEIEPIAERLESESNLKSLDFESCDLRIWDSGLVSYLTSLIDRCQGRGMPWIK